VRVCRAHATADKDRVPAPREQLTMKEKGWCEDTSRSGGGSAPAPRVKLTMRHQSMHITVQDVEAALPLHPVSS